LKSFTLVKNAILYAKKNAPDINLEFHFRVNRSYCPFDENPFWAMPCHCPFENHKSAHLLINMIEIQYTLNSWHRAFAEMLRQLFIPLNITVFPELQVTGNSPEVDIMYFQREQAIWTPEQFQKLPDGIRQCKATYIRIEFKFTETANKAAFTQALVYDYLYKRHQDLTDKDVQTFVVSAKKPRQQTREKLGYENEVYQGVYNSHNEFVKNISLISLNELPCERHNAYFKLFSSHKVEREKAFKLLESEGLPLMPEPLESLLSGLRLLKGEEEMKELTPEQVLEMGRMWGKRYLSMLSPEERLADIPLEERLAGIPLEKRLAGIPTEKRLAGIPLKKRLAGIPTTKRLAGIPP